MYNAHVYLGNYCTFSRPLCIFRAFIMGSFFGVFHEIFSKYREENQYKESIASTLMYLNYVKVVHFWLCKNHVPKVKY
jgi:hypothetical protein